MAPTYDDLLRENVKLRDDNHRLMQLVGLAAIEDARRTNTPLSMARPVEPDPDGHGWRWK